MKITSDRPLYHNKPFLVLVLIAMVLIMVAAAVFATLAFIIGILLFVLFMGYAIIKERHTVMALYKTMKERKDVSGK